MTADPTPDAFDLQDFLPYLLNQAAEAASRGFSGVYRSRHGMTRTQWRVMAQLGRFGTMAATEICRRSHMEKTKVSRAVAAHEGRGWLRREPSPADRRLELLSLTPEGQEVYRELGALALAYDRRLRERLGAARADALVVVLRELIDTGPAAEEGDDAVP